MTDDQLRTAIFRGLRQVAPEIDPSTLSPAESIREALDIDSFDFLQFLIALCRETGVNVPESDYEKVFTLAGLFGYFSARL